MNFYIPQKFSIADVIDGVPYIYSDSIIEKDCIIEINVRDSESGKHTGTYCIDEMLTLCPVKMGDIIELHERSEKTNGYYCFHVIEIGKHYVKAVPDVSVLEI